jgi:ABC-type sugar transport system ATPase subunit
MGRLVLDNVSKFYRGRDGTTVEAVKNLSLAVAGGEFVVIVGPSGCGKTTTLRLIAGLEEATSGSIAIDGRVVNADRASDRDVAVVFQSGALYPHLTVFENMALGLRLRRRPGEEVAKRVGEASQALGLTPVLDRLPHELSGGQAQRVALGRAMVRQPRVFLLDEPLSNLDAPLRQRLRLEIKRWQAHLGATTVYVTHDQAEAMSLAGRLVVMREGSLEQAGSPLDVYRRPASLFVANFIGSPPMNLFPGTFETGPAGPVLRIAAGAERPPLCLPWPLAIPAVQPIGNDGSVVLGIRPERILPVAANTDRGVLMARVRAVEPMGPENFVHLEIGGIDCVGRWPAGPAPAIGAVVPVRIDMADACGFAPRTGRALAVHR